MPYFSIVKEKADNSRKEDCRRQKEAQFRAKTERVNMSRAETVGKRYILHPQLAQIVLKLEGE